MRGSDGKRFDARVPLRRHFPLSRDIRGFFDLTATTGRCGVDGGHFSGSCRLAPRWKRLSKTASTTGPRCAPFGPGTRVGWQVVERHAGNALRGHVRAGIGEAK